MKPAKITVKDTKPGIIIWADCGLGGKDTLALTYEEADDLMWKLMGVMGKQPDEIKKSLERVCPVCKGEYRNLLKHKQYRHPEPGAPDNLALTDEEVRDLEI